VTGLPPGEGIVAWLETVISRREQAARAAHEVAPAPWTADILEGTGLIVAADGQPLWDCEGASALCMTEAAATHAALNDPRDVLRRCAADRKLLALHNTPGNVFPDGAYLDDNRWCVGCGYGNDGEALVDDVNDCPTLNALAEGYGRAEGGQAP
jgi:hypothetical protein